MNKVEGLHHIAICTSDMKSQIEYFTDKLGMELQALYWMHGVENTFHGFLRLNDESSVAFVQNPDIAEVPVELGKTHAGNPGAACSRGSMQHLAFKVNNHDELMAMRDRLRSKGVPVLGLPGNPVAATPIRCLSTELHSRRGTVVPPPAHSSRPRPGTVEPSAR